MKAVFLLLGMTLLLSACGMNESQWGCTHYGRYCSKVPINTVGVSHAAVF